MIHYQDEPVARILGCSDALVLIENCPQVEITGKFSNVELVICGPVDLTFKNVQWVGGHPFVCPGPRHNSAEQNITAMIGDDALPPGMSGEPSRWARVWEAGKRQKFSVATYHIKDQGADYFANKWVVTDVDGIRHPAKLMRFEKGEVWTTVEIETAKAIPAGLGFWETYRPSKFIRRVSMLGVEMEGHETFDIYSARSINVDGCIFGPAKRDYNVGFEHCWDINLRNVEAYGNNSFGPGSGDLSILFGCRSVVATNCNIRVLTASSGGIYLADAPEGTIITDSHLPTCNMSPALRAKIDGGIVVNPDAA